MASSSVYTAGQRLVSARQEWILVGVRMLGADWLAVGVHVYVPYGRAYLPYALSCVRGNPRILWWLVRDAILARGSATQPAQEERELAPR